MNRILAVLATVILLAACTSAGKPGPSAAPGAGRSPSTPATGAPQASNPGSEGVGSWAADLVVARRGAGTATDAFVVLDGGNLRPAFELPAGVAAADWSVLYAAGAAGSGTRIRAIDPNGGGTDRELTVPGAWRLPAIGLGHVLAGLSGDGGTLVLEEARSAAAVGASRQTRFAIVSTALAGPARILSLPGDLDYDAISPNGAWLYVIEHLGGAASHYDVRRVDVAAGKILDGIIVDKRNIDEQMAGYAVGQVAGTGGWVYTVYEGADGPFIHALNTTEGYAFCIDLPGGMPRDAASAAFWSLALQPGGKALYAANGALGVVADVSLDSYEVTRSANLPTAAIVTLAKFGHGTVAAGGRMAALSPDGATLYVLGERGLMSVSAKDLTASPGPGYLVGAYASLTVGASGALYAIDGKTGAFRLDPKNGHQEAFEGGGYSAIVAVVSL